MKLLLHACCGSCACYPTEKLTGEGTDFDILFFGESGGRRKSKKTIKLIAVISAVCAAVAGTIFIIRHNAKKPKV